MKKPDGFLYPADMMESVVERFHGGSMTIRPENLLQKYIERDCVNKRKDSPVIDEYAGDHMKIEQYIKDDGQERETYAEGMGAQREKAVGKGRYDLIPVFATRRLAGWYELGAGKYGDRNWEKGIPYSRCVDSAKRHLDKFIMGMRDEDHLAAAVWNLMAIMDYQERSMNEFDDMPHYIDEMTQQAKSRMKSSTPTPDDKKLDVEFETRGDADAVLFALNDLIERYGYASVGDLYSLSQVTTNNFAVNKYGWTDLRDAKVVNTRGGMWAIRFPRAEPLKDDGQKREAYAEELGGFNDETGNCEESK